jgi:hypothetical protein
MINALILSKNRASQLRLLLESISINASSLFNRITIIYTYSNDDFKKGYEKLQSENILPNIDWQKEKDFMPDFLQAIKNCESEYICGIVDDCVFYKRVPSSPEYIEAFMKDDVFCFSLRLGLNTTMQNYLDPNRRLTLQKYGKGKVCIRWDWKKLTPSANYGYPISLDGHVFRTDELSRISHKFEFKSLRSWEETLTTQRRSITDKNMMVSYKQSVLFSIPSNSVQDPPMISGQRHAYSEKDLNDKYIENTVIDFESIEHAFQNVEWAHNEIELSFKSMN